MDTPNSENNKELNHTSSHDDVVRRVATADSVWIPRDVFEKLYLNPEKPVAGDLRKKFANPTPVALIGFVIAATPYSISSMGWRGAGGLGGALIPVMIFFGGGIQILAACAEWVLGNTFSMCLFFTYGTFWVVAGTQLIPWFNVGSQYSNPVGNTFQGMDEPAYFATFGFYYMSLAVLTVIFTICSLRTNIVFVSALTTLIVAFCCGAGAFWNLAEGNVEIGGKLVVASGACTFALTSMVWYLLAVQLLESVDFPVTLPVGDLSKVIKGKSERAQAKMRQE
ncbi:Protein alcS [Cyphellophora attinorum]|uniref:Protein alcS n=1 Tax=Cyphellophora attinorum TaxID=1664694 RepID=A0A0N0NIQ5_9EURO|nr:Protein alcS [Phialophora attinorum]KPI36018.1 Protein alcS [Phialophora attinorum]